MATIKAREQAAFAANAVEVDVMLNENTHHIQHGMNMNKDGHHRTSVSSSTMGFVPEPRVEQIQKDPAPVIPVVLREGCRVRIHGLKNTGASGSVHFNGTEGRVVGWDRTGRRWLLISDLDGKMKSLRECNLTTERVHQPTPSGSRCGSSSESESDEYESETEDSTVVGNYY